MPAYNCQNYIRKAIDSILNQTYQNFELLIADDGSTDETKSVIDSYIDSRIKTFHNKYNLGYLKTSNKLIKQSNGEYITFLDADDTCALDRLELLYNEFNKNPKLGCVGSYVNRINDEGEIIEVLRFKCDNESIKNDLPFFFNCVGSALMVKKEIIEKLGLYNEYFDRIGSEDLYWYGCIARNHEIKNIPVAIYNYRANPTSISNDKNKSPKKQMSGELASYFIKYYYQTGKQIFSNTYDVKVVELFVIGKSYCWRNEVKIGIWMILKSIFLNPFGYTERFRLLRMYMPKLIKW
jgi:glycosyltransferase involved in cell wall biosynthesis